MPDRTLLTGILFVLETGILWEINQASSWDDTCGWWRGLWSWLNRYRRLKVRYERRADVHRAFLELGCALICWNHVQRFC